MQESNTPNDGYIVKVIHIVLIVSFVVTITCNARHSRMSSNFSLINLFYLSLKCEILLVV